MEDPRDRAAGRFEEIADELDRAASHCRTAALRFSEHLPPRAAAHAFAAWGHLHRASRALGAEAEAFAAKAEPADAADIQRHRD